ncbi:hypothetical protein EHS13_27780 [Paenibacillus psychroresistens]|uniref:DUF455 family protein n=1 Tax=Paenibacillus psychroresistens TaxID=1778678 RepID=A0A6B8RT83_9BACL|nr:hypothetical protein [Paenibacillus psychroresistens]QGQ98418.1 hypothetical protein EHS13_27780 [Paenibacillus psychroresistens]
MNEHREVNVFDKDRSEINLSDSEHSLYLRPKETACLLTDLLWVELELSRMAFGWLPAVKEFETKVQLGRYGYLHNQHAKLLYERLGELPGSLNEKQGSPSITREVVERISLAPSEAAFFAGYTYAVRKLFEEYELLEERLDPILDAPTADKLRYILVDRNEMLKWLPQQVQFAATEDPVLAREITAWRNYAKAVWTNLIESLNSGNHYSPVWPQHLTGQAIGPVPMNSAWNEERFPLYKWNPAYKQSYSDPSLSPLQDSVKQMHYINATEMGAAESLCYLYYAVSEMKLEFYFDTARHLWDEVRHCEMGVRRLLQMGYKTEAFKFFKGSPGKGLKDLTQEWFPNLYAGLTMVAEPCSFIKKRKSAEHFWQFNDALSAIHCEFDMVDERMHVEFGKKWGPELYKQINDIITATEMSERARIRRIEELGEAVSLEEAKKIAKNFPGFCGLSTIELKYNQY